ILFNENDVVPVGTVIARIDTAGSSTGTQAAPAAPAQEAPQPAPQAAPAYTPPPAAPAATGGNRFYSPLVLNIAGKEGIGMTELEQIPGTGNEGRVTKKDILNYVANRGNGAAQPAPAAPSQPASAPAPQPPAQAAPQPAPAATPQASAPAPQP